MWADLKSKESTPTFGQNLKFFFKYQMAGHIFDTCEFAGRKMIT